MDKSWRETLEEIRTNLNPSEVAANDQLQRWLTATGIAGQALKKGEHAPDFMLPDAEGRLLTSRDLRRQGPLVVSFFHGGWCPFCTAELTALEALEPEIAAFHATLVAISPETGDVPRLLKRRLGLARLKILADVDYGVGLAFGVVFSVPRNVCDFYFENGVDLAERHGSAAWMLPIPAMYAIDGNGIIGGAYVTADFTLRQDPAVIIDWLRRMTDVAPAGR